MESSRYKFRAWDKKNSEMRYGYPVIKKGKLESFVEDITGSTFGMEYWPFELMQFTGLKDSIGREIYEGDILSFKSDKKSESGGHIAGTYDYHPENSLEVFWEDARFYVGNYRDLGQELRTWKQWGGLQVIGNIYENPELLNNK